MTRIAVIGAGLSGLVFADTLGDAAQIKLFEKSRGYGGRMATRRHDAFQFEHIALHRWRYASPGQHRGARSLIDAPHRLAAIGDWCIRGRVESAFLSGLDAAQRIRSLI
jgi:predicted NAD/FAD-dependent oxidoreductase